MTVTFHQFNAIDIKSSQAYLNLKEYGLRPKMYYKLYLGSPQTHHLPCMAVGVLYTGSSELFNLFGVLEYTWKST